MLPSGRQPVFANRVSWAVIYMERAGLVERVRRAVYRVTAEGERLLQRRPSRIDLNDSSHISGVSSLEYRKYTTSEKIQHG